MERSGGSKRRRFSDEYKAEAVRLVGDSGKSVGADSAGIGCRAGGTTCWTKNSLGS